jgi:hypothetical protein
LEASVVKYQIALDHRRWVGVLPAFACALAVLSSVTACSQRETPHPSSSPRAASETAGVDRGTPGAAFTDWMREVVRGDYATACREMTAAGDRAPASSPASGATCSSSQGKKAFTILSHDFVFLGITPKTSVTFSGVHMTGPSATIAGTDIHLLGTTLTSLMLKHSTGIKPGEFTLSFTFSRMRGDWYVTGMDMNLSSELPFTAKTRT